MTAHLKRDVHLVDDLRANLLIGMDIIGPERISTDIPARKAIIGGCRNLLVDLQITPRQNGRIRQVVKTASKIVLPPRSVTRVPVKSAVALPRGRDLVFRPTYHGAYNHIVDAEASFVHVRNDRAIPTVIPRHARLGVVADYEEEGCYRAAIEDVDFAAYTKPMTTAKTKLEMPETRLPNGVTIYGKNNDTFTISRVVDAYPDIWEDRGRTVDIPESDYLQVPLRSDWEKEKLSKRVYPLGDEARRLVDEKFDKLHAQGRMDWSTQPTPFGFPVFVVWKTVTVDGQPKRKGRVVVDIRGLNRISQPDSYPLPLQTDITSAVRGCRYISTVDCASFFYQWLVNPADRHKFTVVSHRGQEHFNVAVMGYRNSPPYVQRQMDRILRPYRDFARGYVDDIVVYSRTLEDHLHHLSQVFALFQGLGISLEPTKSYLGYPSVTLLGQRVDGLGLSTAEEKIRAIANLKFPLTLKELETYLGLTGWLREKVPYYAQITEPLQNRKTNLSRTVSTKGNVRKHQASQTSLEEPTAQEKRAFETLQAIYMAATFLHHFDPSRRLYIDVDSSKRYGFGAVVYHVEGDPVPGPDTKAEFPRHKIQPIMFLSKLLTAAERNYWPTELETAGLVWVVRKTRHLIESAAGTTVVFTDHSATTSIAKQSSLTMTTSTDKLNLRLIRASQYLSQFDLDVRHKPGRIHLVPDALSRLLGDMEQKDDGKTGILEDLGTAGTYHVTLVELADDFKKRLQDAYEQDTAWKRILDLTRPKQPDGDEDPADKPPGLQFSYRNGLIYYTDDIDGRERLCIPSALEKEIFELAHDKQHHSGFHRTYDRITASLFIRHLTKRLKAYILHCPECQLNQTRRHAPYGSLHPISTPSIPFHTITMDFILALPPTPKEGFDNLLTVTDKFTKRVLLLPGKTTYSAADWANTLLPGLIGHDWGIPRQIISDRDRKFLSSFWRTIFERLGTKLLTSTAYHPQTDGQSERTNQTVEIALRYFLTKYPNKAYTTVLPYLQGSLNNSRNTSTGYAPNELAYGFRTNDTLDTLKTDLPPEDYNRIRQMYREEAEDSIAFANATSKSYYDAKHTPLTIGSKAYLRLFHGYTIPGLTNRKLSNQRVGPFKILRRIGALAYELDLPPTMRIHPVVSVAQLEPAYDNDPYGREANTEPPPVENEAVNSDNDETAPAYEIERLLDRRVTRRGRGKVTVQYLVKWKGYSHAHNAWYGLEDLQDAKELLDEYARVPILRRIRNGPTRWFESFLLIRPGMVYLWKRHR